MNCGDSKLSELMIGFDLVNEEDFSPEIKTFAKQLIGHTNTTLVMTDGKESSFPLYLHCGETHTRKLNNIQDALALGTKRIGHGF